MDRLLQAQLLRGRKEAWLREAQGLPANHGFALAQTGDLRGSVETLESGRARLLAEALERNRQDLDSLPTLGFGDLHNRYTAAVARYEELVAVAQGPQRPPDWSEQAKAVLDELDRVAEAIRERAGARHPEFAHFMANLPFSAIQRVARGAPLVYLLTTAAGGLALIVRGTDRLSGTAAPSAPVEAVWLDFSTADLGALLVQHQGDDVTGGYLPGQLFDTQWLVESLSEALPLLGERVMGPVADRLRAMGASAALLIPAGHLALLPLHAARYQVDGQQLHFLDEFDVTYAPSARALAAARRQALARSEAPLRLVGVGNPLPHRKRLPYARAELEEVAALFGEQSYPLYDAAATKTALLEALPGASHVHLACHGLFDVEDALKCHVQLANGEPLTLREMLSEDMFGTARLVALSACQTAITEFRDIPDEVIGLPTGLVQAGVPGVVGTLWPVEDLSTALIMVRFYECYLRGDPGEGQGPMPPARALRRAQRWLRDVTADELLEYFERHKAIHEARRRTAEKRMPEEVAAQGVIRFALLDADERPFADSPYHWAPFVFVGA